ncbi:MAG: Cell shape-determining protein MreC [Parcubacteria group bacterium GW2011_GWB1_52_7]|nr:MAG: Cell shape-determining protein MreC [Parcubacteria group bacterium GW2011_GWB1_52_7]
MPKRSPRVSIWWLSAILFLALAVVLLFYNPAELGARTAVNRLTSWAISPLYELGKSWNRLGARLYERTAAFRENSELKEINARLLIDKAEFLRLQKENETLRRALKLQEETQQALSDADIIGAFSEGREEYLIINRGSAAGVSERSAVLSPEGALVGVVRTVSSETSTVRLLSSASEHLTVSILPANVNAALRGDNSGEYVISLVPADAPIAIGDAVVTAGLNDNIPAGIAVGTVAAAGESAAGSFQDIRVKSPVEILFLDRVLVLLGKR